MKILMMLTSFDNFNENNKKTGLFPDQFTSPYYIFKDAGAEITLVTPDGGRPPLNEKNKNPTTPGNARLRADLATQIALHNTLNLRQAAQLDFDALYIAGGYGVLWDVVENHYAISIVESIFAASNPIAAVCHSSSIFCRARTNTGEVIVSGKSVTGFSNSEEKTSGFNYVVPYSVEDELKKNGAKYSKGLDWEPYVISDGLLITGQNPNSSSLTAKTLLNKLKSQGHELKTDMLQKFGIFELG